MHYTFDATSPIDAVVTLMMGELVITADDVTEVTVDVEPTQPDRPADVRAAENTAVDLSNGRLTVIQKRENLVSTWVNKSWSIDVHIRVPKRSRFEAKSAYGNIQVRGPLGRSSLTTSYGSIAAGDADELAAKTSYGEINVDRASGTTSLTGSSVSVGEVYGNVKVKCSQGAAVVDLVMGHLEVVSSFGNIEVRKLMGDIDARTAHGVVRIGDGVSGDATLVTSHGDIEVGIRQGTLTWLDLDTKAGTVRNELSATEPQGDDDGDTADRLKVTARTNHGSVRAFRASAL